MLISGRCHCGNVAFELDWPRAPDVIHARTCTCSFCRSHGATWTSHPKAKLAVAVRDSSRVNVYRFGSGTADFHVCMDCGGVPFVSCLLDGIRHAVVNVNVFDDAARALVQTAPESFESEELEGRLERRKRTWIRDVAYTTPT
jgi:hypothetical protein